MKRFTSVILLCMVFEIRTIKMQMVGLPGDENNECDSVTKDVAEENRNTKILSPHSIIGKWVSEKCESRSGPKFVSRSYTFFSNHTFQLIQFYYEDESCSSISCTVTIVGRYKPLYKSSLSSTAHIKIAHNLRKATIVAHNYPTASKVAAILHKKCPGLTNHYWKPLVEYLLFGSENKSSEWNGAPTDDLRSDETDSSTQTSEKYAQECLAAIDLSLDELNTVRIQSRYSNANGLRYELLLANTYYTDQHLQTLRHKFQLPLILVNGSTNCVFCDTVAQNTHMFLQGQYAKAKFPPYVNGEWISGRCDALSNGLFSMQVLRLQQLSKRWELQMSYYSDYICSHLTMIHRAFGNFEASSTSKRVRGAIDIDFFIDKSYLTVFDEDILHTIRTDRYCGGSHDWQTGETKEIPSRTGCASVDIVYQAKNYDIARLDVDDHGTYLLYLGDEGSTSSISSRPTAYQYPLLRCSRYVDEEQLFQSDSANKNILLPTLFSTFVIMSVFHVLLALLK